MKNETSDFQSYYIILFRISSFQKKILRHTKKKESMIDTKGGKKQFSLIFPSGSPGIRLLITKALNQLFERCLKKTKGNGV